MENYEGKYGEHYQPTICIGTLSEDSATLMLAFTLKQLNVSTASKSRQHGLLS